MTKNEILAAFIVAQENRKAAEKQEKALKTMILEFMQGRELLETDLYSVVIKKTEKSTLDTAALYKDFPDIKKDYGKTTVSRSVDVVARSAAEQKTA